MVLMRFVSSFVFPLSDYFRYSYAMIQILKNTVKKKINNHAANIQ